MHNTWTDLDQLIGWTVDWATTPHLGETWFSQQLIRITPGLPWRTERAVMQHEVIHAQRGPFPGWARAAEERAVRTESARRLIDLGDLARVMAWTQCPSEMADELDVDVPTVRARLDGLTQAERTWLDERLGEVPGWR